MRLRKEADVFDPVIERELAELEAEFGAELRQLRAEPSPEFAADLDARAAAGFGGGAPATDRLARAWERFRTAPPRRQVMPVAASGLAVIVVATAIVGSVGEEQGGSDGTVAISAPASGGDAIAPEPSATPVPSVTEQAGRLEQAAPVPDEG